MSERITFHLADKSAKERACAAIMGAPLGHYATLSAPTRTLDQNRLMWPLIKDFRDQDTDMARFAPDEVKLRFLNALNNEMKMLPELQGGGSFVVGQRSSTLSKRQFSDLIELMFAWGANHEIQWSRKSEETREAMRKESA